MIKKFNTFTFRVDTPDGNAYIQFLEKAPGEIEHILMHIGKAGSSVNAYCSALAELASMLMKVNTPMVEIIAKLQGITSSKPKLITGGVKIGSGPEALAFALIKYKAASDPIYTASDYNESYRPAKITNPRRSA